MSDSKSKSNDADWGFAGFDFAKLSVHRSRRRRRVLRWRRRTSTRSPRSIVGIESWRLMAQTEVFQETMKAIAAECGKKPPWAAHGNRPARIEKRSPTCQLAEPRPSPRSRQSKYCAAFGERMAAMHPRRKRCHGSKTGEGASASNQA